MSRNFLKIAWSLVAVMATCSGFAADERVAAASETNTTSLTMDQLVNEALEKNPEVRFYKEELAAAKAGWKVAGLWHNPEVSGSVGRKTSRELASGASAEGVAWSVSLVQPFEWPGRIGLRKAIADRDVELAELGLERFRVARAARVRVLGYGLFAAQRKADAAAEVAERFKALREVLVQRDAAGIAPLLETRVIEATEVTMQRKASEAELASKSVLLELNQLRGVEPGEALLVSEPALKFGASGSKTMLLAMARTNNFELRVRSAELAQQGFRVALAKNERFPPIRVGPSFSEENAFEREQIIGLGVSFPLPLWNRNGGNMEGGGG